MSKVVLVKRGDKYLPDVQLSELEEMYRCECPGKSRDSLQAAVLRKQGRTLEMMAYTMGRGISTTHRWLFRMGREGPDGRHDGKSPGRPTRFGITLITIRILLFRMTLYAPKKPPQPLKTFHMSIVGEAAQN